MVRRSGQPNILIHRAFPPPPLGSEDAIELDGNPQSIGSIAVRLMATWSLPRMSLVPIREETDRHQLPNSQREDD
jgi:hypothetical protein